MAVIASCHGIHQITAATNLGLCLRRQPSYGGIELAYEGLGRWPGRKKLRYEQTPLGIGRIIHRIVVAKRGKGYGGNGKGGLKVSRMALCTGGCVVKRRISP